jgi:ABC-2 type transport system permease protein
MTWLLVRLKLRILRNGLHGSRSRRVSALLMLLGSLVGSGYGAIRMIHNAHGSGLAREESLVLSMTVLFGLWVFGPLLVGGVDDALDPTRLVLLPLTRRELRHGLMCSALIGVLPLATVVTLAGMVVGYAGAGAAALAVPLAALVMLTFCLSASRALSVGLAFAGRSRRGKDLSVLIASLGAAALFLGTQSIRFLKDSQRHSILRALRLLPPGQLASAVLEADAQRLAIAGTRLAGLGVLSAVLLRAWFRGVDRLLVDPDSIRHTRTVKDRTGLALVPEALRPWITNTTVVMTAKELRYLVRSPQRRSSMIISIVIGTVFALLQSMRFNSADSAAVFGAPIAMLFGVHATNNLLGTDAASLWMEQTAGARLRQQLVARGIAATPNLVVPTILSAFVLACMTGGWSELALVVALSLTCWGVPLGVGSIISVIAPFNQPDVGNPYSNKRSNTGQSGLVSALAFVGIVSLMLLALPCAGMVGFGWERGSVTLVAGGVALSAVYSAAIWRFGLNRALRIVRGREVDLLSAIGGRRAAT